MNNVFVCNDKIKANRIKVKRNNRINSGNRNFPQTTRAKDIPSSYLVNNKQTLRLFDSNNDSNTLISVNAVKKQNETADMVNFDLIYIIQVNHIIQANNWKIFVQDYMVVSFIIILIIFVET